MCNFILKAMDYNVFIEVLTCVAPASFHFAFGVVVGFSAILIPQLESPDSEIQVTKHDVSWIASVIPLVTPISSVLTGYLVDKIGRLNTIKVAVVPYLVGWLCIAMAHNFTQLMIGRVLTGLFTSLACNPAIVYITEVARPSHRGALISLAISLASTGLIVVYAKGAVLHWRMISWISMSYCILPLLLMHLLSSESPAWLISRERPEQALDSLTFIYRKNKNAGSAEQKMEDLLKEHNRKKSQNNRKGSSTRKIFRAFLRPTGYKPVFILTVIFFFQQFSGIYITIFYTVTFLKSVGTSIDPNFSSIIVGVVRLITGLLTLILLNKFGRRPLFIVSCIGMAIFIFISGYYTKEMTEGRMEKNFIPVLCIMLYISVASFGFMVIPWAMTAELFPIEIRGMAQSLMMAVANLMLFLVLKIYPFLDEVLGGAYAVQWFFATVSATSCVVIFLFLPETHKKELSDIQQYFTNNTIYIFREKKTTETDEYGDEMVQLKDTIQQIERD